MTVGVTTLNLCVPIAFDSVIQTFHATYPDERISWVEFEDQPEHERVVVTVCNEENKSRTWAVPLASTFADVVHDTPVHA